MVLPDFRSLGVMLRALLLAEGLRFVLAYVALGNLSEVIESVIRWAGIFEPALLTVLAGLFLASRPLSGLPYRLGAAAVALLAALSGVFWRYLYATQFTDMAVPSPVRVAFTALTLAVGILFYFNWRHRVLSPALSEARLMALQARIRPHFLFNSLNTVLGLMRSEPRRAETVLENLSELFRASMAEASALAPLAKELELARSYAEIEAVRLGGRLTVDWQCQNAPLDALVPPLILQPLLENAVYHGIEPAAGGGTVSVTIFVRGDQLNLVVRNPVHHLRERRSGNRMALENIRERLDLHFDAEAALRAYESGDEFVVQIRMPYRRAAS